MPTNAFRGDATPLAKILRFIKPIDTQGVKPIFTINNKRLEWDDWVAADMVAAINASGFPELEGITVAANSAGDIVMTGPENEDWYAEISITPTVTLSFSQGAEAINQQNRISFGGATGGTYKLTVDGNETAAIAFDDITAARVALNAAIGSANYEITIDGEDYLLILKGTYAADDVEVSIDGSTLTKPVGAIVIVQTQKAAEERHESFWFGFADDSNNAIQLTIRGGVGGPGSGPTSRSLYREMTLEDIQAIVDDLSPDPATVYGSAVGDGDVAASYVIDFHGSPGVVRYNGATGYAFGFGTGRNTPIYTPQTPINGLNLSGEATEEVLLFDLTGGDIELEVGAYRGSRTRTITISQGVSAANLQTQLNDASGVTNWTTFTPDWGVAPIGDHTDGKTHPNMHTVFWSRSAGSLSNVPNITLKQIGGEGNLVRLAEGGSGVSGAEFDIYRSGDVTGGTFDIELEEGTISSLAWDVDASTFETAAQAVRSSVTVTDGSGDAGDPWRWDNGTNADSDQLPKGVASFIGAGSGSVSVSREAADAVNAEQTVQVSTRAASGSYLLQYGSEGPVSFDHDHTSAEFKTQVELFPSLSTTGDTTVTYDDDSGLYTISYGGNLAGKKVSEMILVESTLATADDESNAVLDQRPTGPSDYSNKDNWTLGRLPRFDDDIVIDDTPFPITYGFTQFVRCTFSPGDDFVNVADGFRCEFRNGQIVRVFPKTGATMPVSIAEDTDYYVVNVDETRSRFKLSATENGAPIDLTTSGIGTLRVGVKASTFSTSAKATSDIGLPEQTGTFREYRNRYLMIGVDLTADFGEGVGQGTSLTRVDLGDSDAVVRVLVTGTSKEDGYPAVNILCDSTGLRFAVMEGIGGIAAGDSESSQVRDIGVHGGEARFGTVHVTTDFLHDGGDWSSRELTIDGQIKSHG